MENNKNHILIVDDDDRIRGLLKDYLSENSYIVSTAENADEAKKKLEYIKFDIIILDGITRREVIKIAKSKGVKVTERKIKPDEMKDFAGCFLTGTAAEVTPVCKISKYNFTVCDLITDLNETYQNLVRKKPAA